MSNLSVSNIEQEMRTNTSNNTDVTAACAGSIELFPNSETVDSNRDFKPSQSEISQLEKTIEKDKQQLDALLKKQKAGIKGSFDRTEKQENILCGIGGSAIALGTLGTWIYDSKNGYGGMLTLFSGMGLLGGMLAAAIPVGITAYLMRYNNKKHAENELAQSIMQLNAKIAEEQELLKTLKESV